MRSKPCPPFVNGVCCRIKKGSEKIASFYNSIKLIENYLMACLCRFVDRVKYSHYINAVLCGSNAGSTVEDAVDIVVDLILKETVKAESGIVRKSMFTI